MRDSSGGLHYSRDTTEPIEAPELTYSNPHRQRVGPRWVRGEVVVAMPCGVDYVDPQKQRWAKEYVLCYAIEGPDGRPERVPGQFGIYDSRPGEPTIARSGGITMSLSPGITRPTRCVPRRTC